MRYIAFSVSGFRTEDRGFESALGCKVLGIDSLNAGVCDLCKMNWYCGFEGEIDIYTYTHMYTYMVYICMYVCMYVHRYVSTNCTK
jgi:hypothetical protein